MTEGVFGARLIVWPEAALPMLPHEAGPWLARMWEDAQRHGSDLMLGLLRYDSEDKKYYNGLLALSGDEAGWYYKRRLVPFGEFFPVPGFIRSWMRLMSLSYVDMTPGADEQPALDAAGQKIGVTICYEDAYGSEQLAVLEDATLLVNVTNNAWFGDSTAPHQQLQMARFRALEAGRYLARATSNGISAIIGPDGAVIGRAVQFVPEVLEGSVTPFTGLTPYARTGNWPVLLGCALLAGVAFAAGRRPARKQAA
jgi:apolipoprotein N-acyltransferase